MCRYGNGQDQSAKSNLPSWATLLPCNDGYAYAAPVGIFLPNAFGLHDVHGNVYELLSAIKIEFDKYGGVVSALAKQLVTASNSVETGVPPQSRIGRVISHALLGGLHHQYVRV